MRKREDARMFLKFRQWFTATLLLAFPLIPCGSLAQQAADRCTVIDLGTNATQNSRSSGEAARGVYALLDAWRDALREGDLERVAALVTEDAEFWSQATVPLTGRTALADAFRPFVADYRLVQDLECDELVVRGDFAFLRGTEHNRLIPHAGGDTVVVEQRAFSIMRLGADGRWRFARGMTNQPPQQ